MLNHWKYAGSVVEEDDKKIIVFDEKLNKNVLLNRTGIMLVEELED
jgi:hypothetical protein